MFWSLATAFMFYLVLFPGLATGTSPYSQGSLTSRTPYDRQYQRVESYLAAKQDDRSALGRSSFSVQRSRIRRYLRAVHSFRFQSDGVTDSGAERDYWQLPEETERRGTGDCEDLAIWLYCRLLEEGFQNVRLTIGLAGENEKTMHAWVTWYGRGKVFILDPSRKQGVFQAGESESVTYRPLYSYYFDRKWHHL